MIPLVPLVVSVLFAALERRELLTDAALDFYRSIKAMVDDGREELSKAELLELGVRGMRAGVDLRGTVLARVKAGGDWFGRMTDDERDAFSDAVEAARSRVAGGGS